MKDPSGDITLAVGSGTTDFFNFMWILNIGASPKMFLLCHPLSISSGSVVLNVSSFVLFLTAKKAVDESKSDAQHVKEKVNTASPTSDNSPLPPFNPHNPVGKIGFIYMIGSVVFSCHSQPILEHLLTPFFLFTGMEFLAPKTGFFCKVCNRFFSGAKEAEIAHCKTRKHYDNVKVSAIHMCNVGTQI